MQVLQDHVAVINVVDAVVAGTVLAFGLELEFIPWNCFFFLLVVTMNGDNVTKEVIWIVVELWLEMQQRDRICDSAPLH